MKFGEKILQKRFALLALFLIILNFIVFVCIIWDKYPSYRVYDGWVLFVYEFKKMFLNPGYAMFSDIGGFVGYRLAGYWHAGCPLYPFLAAGVSLVAGNIMASMILTSTMISVLGLYYTKKIAKEYMHYDDAQSYQLICIFITFSVVSEFFSVPLPLSITVTIPILDTYYFLRFFHSPSMKNGVLLTSIFTLTLFTRELLFPFLLVPLSVLVLLKLKISIQHIHYNLNFKHRFIVLLCTTVLIPCGIYAIYLFTTGTYESLIMSLNPIILCPKILLAFAYMSFNTITFNWIFVLFSFIMFLRTAIQYIQKNNRSLQPITVKSGNDDSSVGNHGRNSNMNTQVLESDLSKEDFLHKNLVDYTNVMWLVLLYLSRIILPGCFCEAYFLPVAFILAVYVLKGTRITNNPRIHEYLFWVAIVMNVVVLVTQVFDFYPFIQEGTNMIGAIDEWLRKEFGWPFYPY